jgi:hypothetical protein
VPEYKLESGHKKIHTGNGNQPSLTNIPYGKDQIGGGSSNQPYIQIPIPDNVSS